MSSNSFQLEWSPPPEEDRNGIITGYTLQLGGNGVEFQFRVGTTHTNYTFSALQQGTTYLYAIAAETIEGTGPFSNRTPVLTEEEDIFTPINIPVPVTGDDIDMTTIQHKEVANTNFTACKFSKLSTHHKKKG